MLYYMDDEQIRADVECWSCTPDELWEHDDIDCINTLESVDLSAFADEDGETLDVIAHRYYLHALLIALERMSSDAVRWEHIQWLGKQDAEDLWSLCDDDEICEMLAKKF